MIIDITEKQKQEFNRVVTHPLQAYEWGSFREKTKVKVIRRGFEKNSKLESGFQLTIHKIPKTPFNIGYLGKGTAPTKEEIAELVKIGKENKCVFIQLEPNVKVNHESGSMNHGKNENPLSSIIHNSSFMIQPSAHPLFTKYTFQLDLTKSEEELLKGMHPKTRYNIRVAEKHNVKVVEENSDQAFEAYLKLTKETTNRQGFYAHTENYHRLMWETLKQQMANSKWHMDENELSAHLFIASYTPSAISHTPIPLVAWILFTFHDTLYYPYGASSSEHRETMASNLMMWEAIKFGKKMGLKTFDMWGALGPEPDIKDPWYGFHKFKQGYGTQLVEFVGSYDLVINPAMYQIYKLADKARWAYLRIRK